MQVNMAEHNLLSDYAIDRMQVGVFAVDREFRICLWNHFLEINSGRRALELLGKNLFEAFPELPRPWLERKINSVFLLGNYAFTSAELRPYLFRFPHNRPVTGGLEFMLQECTFLPVRNEEEEITHVCVNVFDVTDKGVYQDELKKALFRLEQSSQRDGLTGVFNRRHFDQRLSEEMRRVRRYGGKLSLLMLDLDHFKNVNDTHGHVAGDAVLREVAERIGAQVRDTDIFGRYGGEEFGIVLPNTDMGGAVVLAVRIRLAVRAQPVRFEKIDIPVTISIGVTELRPDTQDRDAFIEEADHALYRAKAKGRDRVSRFLPGVSDPDAD